MLNSQFSKVFQKYMAYALSSQKENEVNKSNDKKRENHAAKKNQWDSLSQLVSISLYSYYLTFALVGERNNSTRKLIDHSILCCDTDLQRMGISSEVLFSHHKEKSDGTVQPVIFIRLAESAALSWDSCMLCVCAWKALTTILRQNGLRFPPPPSATMCISPDFFPRGKATVWPWIFT